MTTQPVLTTTAKLVGLVIDQRKQSKDDGGSVNLRSCGIAETLPEEIIEMIKDEVSRYNPFFFVGPGVLEAD